MSSQKLDHGRGVTEELMEKMQKFDQCKGWQWKKWRLRAAEERCLKQY